jgi:hypothetical protein
MKKNGFFMGMFGLTLVLSLAAGLFTGCATTGGSGGASPGTLTITGIPAEYQGKYILIKVVSANKSFTSSKNGVTGTVITNGEVNLPLYKEALFSKGFLERDTGDIELSVMDTEKISSGKVYVAGFETVQFENGAAAVQWNDGAVLGIAVTITGIPAGYNDKRADIAILAENVTRLFDTALTLRGEGGDITGGSITVKIYSDELGKSLLSGESYTKDIWLRIIVGEEEFNGYGVTGTRAITDNFLFKAVQINNGTAAPLDFTAGVKQK